MTGKTEDRPATRDRPTVSRAGGYKYRATRVTRHANVPGPTDRPASPRATVRPTTGPDRPPDPAARPTDPPTRSTAARAPRPGPDRPTHREAPVVMLRQV